MNDTQLTANLEGIGKNRRSFVKKLAFAGAVLGAAAETKSAQAQSAAAYTDFDIVNFALNLEYLEAEFYTVATTGAYIDSLGISITGQFGTAGATTGGNLVTFTDPQVAAIALELANDEQQHVVLLQEAITSLGGQYATKPAINLNALGVGFASQAEFLTLARAFEDIGVTAYAGAAPLIVNTTVLGYAARILAVEALHSGSIRNAVDRLGVAVTALDPADIIPPPAGTLFFPTNNQALVETRTPNQVLYIAYGGVASAASGGFFPSGINDGYSGFTTASATPATYDGASLTASPNPASTTPGVAAQVTLTWSAPSATVIEIHVGSPSGPLFTHNVNSGSMQTGTWVTNGLVFYLQDVSLGQALTSTYTLATVTVTVTS
jgi:hypothetical protein